MMTMLKMSQFQHHNETTVLMTDSKLRYWKRRCSVECKTAQCQC